jgi:hypothetical protein
MIARSGEFDSPLGEYEAVLEGVPQLTTDTDAPSTEAIVAEDADLVIGRGTEDLRPGTSSGTPPATSRASRRCWTSASAASPIGPRERPATCETI